MESFTLGVSVTGWSWEKYWSLNLRPFKGASQTRVCGRAAE